MYKILKHQYNPYHDDRYTRSFLLDYRVGDSGWQLWQYCHDVRIERNLNLREHNVYVHRPMFFTCCYPCYCCFRWVSV